MKDQYGHGFYKDRHLESVYAARTILPLVLDALPPVNSAIDFGCGVGTWLSVLKEKGAREIQGIDGPWLDQNLLQIPKENFRQVNFEEGIQFGKRYDLAISLEVAEHLSQESANRFVEMLVGVSDCILFSAAIPFQGGRSHINEQWLDYWVDIFASRGYLAFDFVRKKIWNDGQIPYWYRQNILLFVKKNQARNIKIPGSGEPGTDSPISLVHPDLYLSKVRQMSSVSGSWKLFRRAVRAWVKESIGWRG